MTVCTSLDRVVCRDVGSGVRDAYSGPRRRSLKVIARPVEHHGGVAAGFSFLPSSHVRRSSLPAASRRARSLCSTSNLVEQRVRDAAGEYRAEGIAGHALWPATSLVFASSRCARVEACGSGQCSSVESRNSGAGSLPMIVAADGGTITGCYVTNSLQNGFGLPYGTLRVIEPSDTTNSQPGADACTTGEATITWNQQGPTGPEGPTGPQGPPGTPGTQGATGANGANGTIIGETTFDIEAASGTRILLEIAGVPTGESKLQSAPKGAAALRLFAIGGESPSSIGSASSGASAGKATIETFEFVKATGDNLSQLLLRDEATGTAIHSATVVVEHVKGSAITQVARYVLTHLVIKNIIDSGETETVTGLFQNVSITIGSGSSQVPAGWNQVTNVPLPQTGIAPTGPS